MNTLNHPTLKQISSAVRFGTGVCAQWGSTAWHEEVCTHDALARAERSCCPHQWGCHLVGKQSNSLRIHDKGCRDECKGQDGERDAKHLAVLEG